MRSTQVKWRHHFSVPPGLPLGVPHQVSLLQCIEPSPSTTQVQMVSMSRDPVPPRRQIPVDRDLPRGGHFSRNYQITTIVQLGDGPSPHLSTHLGLAARLSGSAATFVVLAALLVRFPAFLRPSTVTRPTASSMTLARNFVTEAAPQGCLAP